jgi:hypothetical protein
VPYTRPGLYLLAAKRIFRDGHHIAAETLAVSPVASRKNTATAPAAVPTRLAGAKAAGFGLILGVGY